MKKIILLSMCMVVASTVALAQPAKKITVKVPDNTDLNAALSDSRFLFFEFFPADVYLKQSVTKAKMNYNLLSQEMMFIDSKDDTMALKNKDEVEAILIEKRLFKNTSSGFMEYIGSANDDKVNLLLKRYIDLETTAKYGAYGIPSHTGAIENADLRASMQIRGVGTQDLTSTQSSHQREFRFQRKDVYYLEMNGKLRIANLSGFQKTFSKQSSAIKKYVQDQSLNLNNEDDIVKLFNYCKSLSGNS